MQPTARNLLNYKDLAQEPGRGLEDRLNWSSYYPDTTIAARSIASNIQFFTTEIGLGSVLTLVEK